MIYLDVDGVLADFIGGACEAFGYSPPVEADGQVEFHWYRSWDMTSKHFFDHLPSDLAYRLAPLPWAKLLLRRCLELDEVRILSAPWGDPCAWSGRLKWLRERLGVLPKDVILVGDPAEKLYFADRHNYLIDDNAMTIEKWRILGGRGLLWPGPANQHWKCYYRMLEDANAAGQLPKPPPGRGCF